jgi:hypothetical protein
MVQKTSLLVMVTVIGPRVSTVVLAVDTCDRIVRVRIATKAQQGNIF